MYIKTKDKRLFKEIDKNLFFSKQLNKFITNLKKTHNLIIKRKKEHYCTYCKQNIYLSKSKINECSKCPICHQLLLVKSSSLKRYEFSDRFGILEKYQDYYIIRYFELKTYYNPETFSYDVCEYGRKIFDDKFMELYEIINNHTTTGMGYCSILHDGKLLDTHWRYFSSYWKALGNDLIYYPYNLKQIFKGTKWQYSQLWILAKKEQYFDMSYLLRNYLDSIELLIKLGFYKLAFCPKTFNKKGSFENRFGIGKEYAKYIKNHNLNIIQLEILKLLKEKNIKIIKYYAEFIQSDYNFFRENNIDLKLLYKKTNINSNNLYEYKDYIGFAKKLKYDLKDKKILYPKNIEESHNKLLKQYQIKKDKIINSKIVKRYKQLKKNTFRTKKYIIFPAISMDSLIDESNQQNNCVKTYAENYANKECDIYFMRLANTQDQSLVTVEVRNNKVVQKRTKNNNMTNDSQNRFLDLWENTILSK